MNLPSNTSPDGDFVRYVEQLSSASANVAARAANAADAARTVRVQTGAPRVAAPVLARPAAKPVASAFAGTPFFTHVKWVIAFWIATQALGRVAGWAAYLFIPALLVYAAWVLFKANRETRGGLFAPLLEKLRQAAREAEKRGQSGQQK